MAHQLVYQPPHDEEGGVAFRGANFAGPSSKGAAALFFTVGLFGLFVILFQSLLPPSLLFPHVRFFGAAVIWATLSGLSTALTVSMLTVSARIVRSAARVQ